MSNHTPPPNGASSSELSIGKDDWENDPENPHNWPNSRRWLIALTIAITAFICTLGASIIAPSIHVLIDELSPGANEKVGILTTSIYVLGMGFGPFLFSPIAEVWGRQTAYLLSMGPFPFFNAACCASQNIWTLIILRFICGVCASAGPSLGVATIADMFKPNERGRPTAIYTMGPMAGPTFGSMFGVWLYLVSWRWTFGVFAIISGLNTVSIILFMRETYAPVLKAKRAYFAGREDDHSQELSMFAIKKYTWMKHIVSRERLAQVFKLAFIRPFKLLFTNAIALSFSTYYAYIYGIVYIFIICIPLLYGRPPFSEPDVLFAYQWPTAVMALGYVGITIGFFSSASLAALLQDRIYRKLCQRNGDNGQPEYRLVYGQLGMVLLPLGLLIFGWCAHAETFWIGPMIGQVVLGLGLMMAWNSVQTYLVDAFHPYSAAAVAGSTALRSILGAILPLWGPEMWRNLGWGVGATVLAAIAALAIPLPILMFFKGREIRERQKFKG